MKPNFTTVALLLAACLSFNTFRSFSQCFPAPVAPVYTPVRISINQNEAVNYTVSNAVTGYFYEVIDSASGHPLGRGEWAIIDGQLLLTTDPFVVIGTYTIYIRATFLLGATQCTAVSAYGTVIVNPAILPLELIQFKGKKQGTAVVLEWQTANEASLNHFEIERSETGSLFAGIGQAAATALANAGQHYTFTDLHPFSSVNYYRLKMVDQDGKLIYSNTIILKVTGSLTASVLPNPFTEKIVLQVALENPQVLNIRLMNAAGALVYTREVKGLRGNNTILINDLTALPAGSYFVQVKGTEDAVQQKIVKINR